MSMFTVASIPLIRELYALTDVIQLWHADDATATGEMSELRKSWDNINTLGKPYGYFPNVCKTVLLVKEELYERVCRYFEGSNVMIRTDGVKLLGSPTGTKHSWSLILRASLRVGLQIWICYPILLNFNHRPLMQHLYMKFIVDGLIFLDPAMSQLIISIV